MAGNILGAAIVIGHVETVEADFRIGGHVGGGADGIQRHAALLHVRHLPEAGDDATDLESGRKLGPGRAVYGLRSHEAGLIQSGTTSSPLRGKGFACDVKSAIAIAVIAGSGAETVAPG